ncbi:disease resistance protein RUN1-like [Syzygium oleosum]|uniref:disease resistance protein RUN1-like n=1 Tax=Syzygium oleosum TaxID=219896 RepID=UPI0011D284D9|nr:disease resistance protein RUN1-like [Syzygium oleosum]
MANSSKMMIRFGQLKRKLFPPFSPPPMYPSLRNKRASQFQLQSPPISLPSFFPHHFSSFPHGLTARPHLFSPPSSIPRWVHDTFISYKQADTRNFVSHLRDSLERNKIRAFVDHSLERGLEIVPAINVAIERSRSAIVVISQNYASSPWCLDELDKILECKEKNGQLVFLIFMDVDPREMREQAGPFTQIGQGEKGFAQENADKVQRWREALRKAGNLTGWPLGNRLEAEFIQSVVEKISRRLSGLYTNLLAFNPVGLDSQLQALYSLLQLEVGEVRIVGISGTSGIGKTTLARALYHRIADQFDRSCFLANVKDISSQDGLVKMQETLFGDVLNDGVLQFSDDIYAVINFMRSKLQSKRVLLVIDDVEGLLEPLSHMIKAMNLGLGSRVILIPRHEENLIGLCGDIYKVRALNDDQALELFSWNAFKERYPKSDYKMLSNCFTSFSKGLPLVLTVIGSFLNGKTVKEWQGTFDRLKEIPRGKVHEITRIVIDGLEANERTVFLDIACFLNGYDKEEIIKSLDQCGVHANSGIEILAQKLLIYSDEKNKIWMHDLFEEMGRRIVIEECPQNPSKRSRIWRHEDALQVFRQNSGADAIEGIKLDKVDVEDLIMNADSFKKMKKLRLFMMADHVLHCGPAGHLSENLWRCFVRNNIIMFTCWEALVKQVSKFWSRGA